MSPIQDTAGRVTGVSVIARDITRQKQLTEAFQEKAQELMDFFAESPLGLLFVGPDWCVERVNPSQLAMIGRSEEEADVVGERVADWFAYADGAAELMGQLRGRNTVKNFRTEWHHANGSTIHVMIDANGVWRDDQLKYSRWFVRDVTQRVLLEQEVLKAVDNEQIRFGQDLHDDLCQQLAGIEFFCQRLAGEQASQTAKGRVLEIAALVRGAINHTRELARGLAPVSAEGKSLMFALRDLAHRTQTTFRCDCRFQCDPPILLENQAASSHLYRIAQEAVSNAIRHGKARRIEIALTRQSEDIILQIADHGAGLPLKQKERPGIGLRIMNYRAGLIGASLVVRRRRGGGTEVLCTMRAGKSRAPGETP